MMNDEDRAAVNAVLDRIDAARTPGEALDAIPDAWPRFLSGPDQWGFHFAVKPTGAPDMIARMYDRGLGMGKGATQMEAIRSGAEWVRDRLPEAPTPLHVIKSRAFALTLATEALNDVHLELEAGGNHDEALIVNEEVQKLAAKMDKAQYALLKHFGRGNTEGWDDTHPLNEALWSGQATPSQIRDYA